MSAYMPRLLGIRLTIRNAHTYLRGILKSMINYTKSKIYIHVGLDYIQIANWNEKYILFHLHMTKCFPCNA